MTERRNDQRSELGKSSSRRVREARLRQFDPSYRSQIAALTSCSPEAEDLTESFPALLFALVSDYATAPQRTRAFQTILEGGSLKVAAEYLGLPMWLKRLPACAFRQPLSDLPDDAEFAERIGNYLPTTARSAAGWLDQVMYAYDACGPRFALWIARHHGALGGDSRLEYFQMLTAWVWYSNQPGTLGHRIMHKPWCPQMGYRRAGEELFRWRRRIALAYTLGDGAASSWLRPGRSGDFDIVPLQTAEDFIEESNAMENCLDQYSERLSTGLIRIFSVRKGGQRIADLEIGPIQRNSSLPQIIQLKAARNRPAPSYVWEAVQEWLRRQPLGQIPRRPGPIGTLARHQVRSAFWSSYLTALPAHRRVVFEAQLQLAQPRRPDRPVNRCAAVPARHRRPRQNLLGQL